MWSFFVALSIKEFYASTHSRPCYFPSKDKISWCEKIICDCWIYSGVWEVEACALQDYIARKSEFAAKDSFHRIMNLFMICALCVLLRVLPSLIHFLCPMRSAVEHKKNPFLLRHNPDERDEQLQEYQWSSVKVNHQKTSQVLWRMLLSAVSAKNHHQHKQHQWAVTIQKWLFEGWEKYDIINNFLMESHWLSLCFGI